MEQSSERKTSSGDRAYYRVRVDIPLRATFVDEDQVEQRASEVLCQLDPAFPDLDPALIGWLDRIERKLNRLLAHEDLLDEVDLGVHHREVVDLSAAGMHFLSDRPIALGAAMLLEFELPEVPVRLIRCLGRVTGTGDVDSNTHRNPVGVAFETIRQADRDAVVRYTLAVQRQTIRSTSQHRGESG